MDGSAGLDYDPEELVQDGIDPLADLSRSFLFLAVCKEVSDAGNDANVRSLPNGSEALGEERQLRAEDGLSPGHQRTILTIGLVHVTPDVRIADQRINPGLSHDDSSNSARVLTGGQSSQQARRQAFRSQHCQEKT